MENWLPWGAINGILSLLPQGRISELLQARRDLKEVPSAAYLLA